MYFTIVACSQLQYNIQFAKNFAPYEDIVKNNQPYEESLKT